MFFNYIWKLNESLEAGKSKFSFNDNKARDWVNPGLLFFFAMSFKWKKLKNKWYTCKKSDVNVFLSNSKGWLNMTWEQTYEIVGQLWTVRRNIKRLKLLTLKENNHKLERCRSMLPLEFGTAGMRGIIGVGINRMNQYTDRQANRGG